MKYKSKMKDIYKSIGLNAARYCLVDTFENALAFVEKVGYPIVVKPDNGVGASSTYKLKDQSELEYFFATKDNRVYIMEEYVTAICKREVLWLYCSLSEQYNHPCK